MIEDRLSLSSYPTELSAREAVIACALRMNALGINHGKSGNVSCRWDRSAASGFLITPSAIPFHRLEPADLVWMRLGASLARQVESPYDAAQGPSPSSEWRFHHDLYEKRPELRAVVHTHSLFAATLASLPRVQSEGIPSFHYMIASCGGFDLRCARYETYGTQALSESVVLAMQARYACLMANHGQLAAGATLYAALSRAEEVEKLSQMYWQALQLGEPALLTHGQMRQVLVKLKNRL